MSGVNAFFFTTFVITFFGEIFPQAWFSRNALKVGSALTPLVKLFQLLFYPLARPSGMILDRWLGPEGLHFFSEETLKVLLRKHINSSETEIEKFEGMGALNFLKMDDLSITEEGEAVHPDSIFQLPLKLDLPEFPPLKSTEFANIIKKLSLCPVKWGIFLNEENEPVLVIDTDGYIKAFYSGLLKEPYQYCHRPIIFKDINTKMADVIYQFKVYGTDAEDDVIKHDIVLLWSDNIRKVITGADILGRLLRGIVEQDKK